MDYYCEPCGYRCKRKYDFEKHEKTNKHRRLAKVSHFSEKVSQKLAILPKKVVNVSQKLAIYDKSEIAQKSSDDSSEVYACPYCDKVYKHRSSRCKHVKYSCKKNKDEDLQELARLLNLQQKNYDSNMMAMQKQIDTLSKKLEIKSVNNPTLHIDTVQQNNAIQNFQFTILNHKDTDYSFLTDKDYIKCINTCNYCVKSLIEKVHFNQHHPENMNIYIPSIKTDYLMIYKDNVWSIVNRKKHIELLYDMNEVQLENWYEDCKNKYPGIIESFNRYLYNKETSEILNEVKKEIIRMLYNNRHLVLDNKDENCNYVLCED
jgi:uncharacterized C2H2 Zn-finger protein